jgi:hypothetical protein
LCLGLLPLKLDFEVEYDLWRLIESLVKINNKITPFVVSEIIDEAFIDFGAVGL